MTSTNTDEAFIIQEFIDTLESLRYLRQAQWHGRNHPLQKRFTQEEIATGPYRAYRNLLTGRTKRLPQRPTVLEIADYLEADVDETNQLLMAARYLPEEKRLNTTDMQLMRHIIDEVFDKLSIPALLLSPELNVERINDLFARLFKIDLPLETEMSVIDLYFNDKFPIAAQLSAKEKQASEQTSYVARTFLGNPPGILRNQDWYRHLKKQVERYLSPGLAHQHKTQSDHIGFRSPKGVEYHLRCLQLSGTPGYSPVIFGCTADDPQANRLLNQRNVLIENEMHEEFKKDKPEATKA